MTEKIFRLIFWVGYMAVFVVAFTPLKFNIHKITVNIISFKFHLDQVLHAIVYFLICMYFLTGKYRGLKLFKSNSIIEFLIVLLILATITEVVQLTVPSRTFNVFDIAANFVGIVVGIIVISLAEGCRLSR